MVFLRSNNRDYDKKVTPIVTVYTIQDSEFPHLLDPMHIKRNIIMVLTKTLSNLKGTKSDSLGVRQEMQAQNMMPTLHPRETNEANREGRPLTGMLHLHPGYGHLVNSNWY